jgi:hypothetical protein
MYAIGASGCDVAQFDGLELSAVVGLVPPSVRECVRVLVRVLRWYFVGVSFPVRRLYHVGTLRSMQVGH